LGFTQQGLDASSEQGTGAAPHAGVRGDAGACVDELGAELVRPSCDGQKILVKHPIELHPQRRMPLEPTKSTLAELGRLLREHTEILLVRIEVDAVGTLDSDPSERRHELDKAQARADALLEYLWRREGISPERLEALGVTRRAEGGRTRWQVTLRIAQRRGKGTTP
jgi:hypothetical protein